MRTGKKHFIFIAVCCCLLVLPGVLCIYVGGASATVEITAQVSLIAYNVTATAVTNSTETITWMTNGLTNSTVDYGLDTSYGRSENNSEMVTSHAITLEGLSGNQLYHYRVVSSDSSITTNTSPDFTFSTRPDSMLPTSGGKSFTGGSGGGGSVSTLENIAGMPALDLLTSPPTLTIASGSLIPLTADNLVAQPVVIISGDGSASLSIDTSTRILDKDGQPLSGISLTRIAAKDVPTVPKGSLFVFTGYAYQIEPSGATFSPALALKITPTPEEWKQISGQELSIQYYNPVSGLWEALSTATDPATHTVTTMIHHASDFGLFIRPASPASPLATITTTTTISQIVPVPGVLFGPGRIIVVQLIALITTIVIAGSIGLYFYRKWNGYKLK